MVPALPACNPTVLVEDAFYKLLYHVVRGDDGEDSRTIPEDKTNIYNFLVQHYESLVKIIIKKSVNMC